MDGRGPYRIYDPGGSEQQIKDETGNISYQELMEENAALRERMKGLKVLGDLLEESQTEASKLRQRVEELVKDNEVLRSSNSFMSLSPGTHIPLPGKIQDEVKHEDIISKVHKTEAENHPPATKTTTPSSGGSSEFEVANLNEGPKSNMVLQTSAESQSLSFQLQELEGSLNTFAEEANKNQLFMHLGRMALELNRLSSKVQKNEQKTTILQTLCEQLRRENEDLREKMNDDLKVKVQDFENLKQENQELKKIVKTKVENKEGLLCGSGTENLVKQASVGTKMEVVSVQQCFKDKADVKSRDIDVFEKKLKALEQQRGELVEVNKQWDKSFRSMKQQYEQKITELRQRLADSQKAVADLEAEREQRQRDYDRKLLLAKSKIENEESEKEKYITEVTELKQKIKYMQDQLNPLTKQWEYQEKEIQRLNKALEEALNLQTATAPQATVFNNHGDGGMNLRRQELLTQISVLKEQVKIYEEDFQKERSDRERMNEEKEKLKKQVERLQGQVSLLNNQLLLAQSDCQRERMEKGKLERLHRHLKQGQHERVTSDADSAATGPAMAHPYQGAFVYPLHHPGHQGLEDWPIRYPPRTTTADHGRDFHQYHLDFAWQPFPQPRSPKSPAEVSSPTADNPDPVSPVIGKSERHK
ncbi:TNFAIP3-interacting protein 1 isoform X1 [Erpetoichthys calabaricus]|uniref:TNFAIP3-interacting protein 1 n=1 Tax=Erpetoichthys calabaricus TaxID=27687 RepID=A0A8C4T6T9_ERPCA|nr:TNFAIP3-interacting protein 1 isoform X1 [Erpetoichthys calabaricus]